MQPSFQLPEAVLQGRNLAPHSTALLEGLADSGGEGGIRTPDRGVSPYNGLANRRLQPLGHLSGRFCGCFYCTSALAVADAGTVEIAADARSAWKYALRKTKPLRRARRSNKNRPARPSRLL
jgi:hypothetical protein